MLKINSKLVNAATPVDEEDLAMDESKLDKIRQEKAKGGKPRRKVQEDVGPEEEESLDKRQLDLDDDDLGEDAPPPVTLKSTEDTDNPDVEDFWSLEPEEEEVKKPRREITRRKRPRLTLNPEEFKQREKERSERDIHTINLGDETWDVDALYDKMYGVPEGNFPGGYPDKATSEQMLSREIPGISTLDEAMHPGQPLPDVTQLVGPPGAPEQFAAEGVAELDKNRQQALDRLNAQDKPVPPYMQLKKWHDALAAQKGRALTPRELMQAWSNPGDPNALGFPRTGLYRDDIDRLIRELYPNRRPSLAETEMVVKAAKKKDKGKNKEPEKKDAPPEVAKEPEKKDSPPEDPKTEPTKEPEKKETPPEAPRVDAPKADAPKADAPKTEAPSEPAEKAIRPEVFLNRLKRMERIRDPEQKMSVWQAIKKEVMKAHKSLGDSARTVAKAVLDTKPEEPQVVNEKLQAQYDQLMTEVKQYAHEHGGDPAASKALEDAKKLHQAFQGRGEMPLSMAVDKMQKIHNRTTGGKQPTLRPAPITPPEVKPPVVAPPSAPVAPEPAPAPVVSEPAPVEPAVAPAAEPQPTATPEPPVASEPTAPAAVTEPPVAPPVEAPVAEAAPEKPVEPVTEAAPVTAAPAATEPAATPPPSAPTASIDQILDAIDAARAMPQGSDDEIEARAKQIDAVRGQVNAMPAGKDKTDLLAELSRAAQPTAAQTVPATPEPPVNAPAETPAATAPAIAPESAAPETAPAAEATPVDPTIQQLIDQKLNEAKQIGVSEEHLKDYIDALKTSGDTAAFTEQVDSFLNEVRQISGQAPATETATGGEAPPGNAGTTSGSAAARPPQQPAGGEKTTTAPPPAAESAPAPEVKTKTTRQKKTEVDATETASDAASKSITPQGKFDAATFWRNVENDPNYLMNMQNPFYMQMVMRIADYLERKSMHDSLVGLAGGDQEIEKMLKRQFGLGMPSFGPLTPGAYGPGGMDDYFRMRQPQYGYPDYYFRMPQPQYGYPDDYMRQPQYGYPYMRQPNGPGPWWLQSRPPRKRYRYEDYPAQVPWDYSGVAASSQKMTKTASKQKFILTAALGSAYHVVLSGR